MPGRRRIAAPAEAMSEGTLAWLPPLAHSALSDGTMPEHQRVLVRWLIDIPNTPS